MMKRLFNCFTCERESSFTDLNDLFPVDVRICDPAAIYVPSKCIFNPRPEEKQVFILREKHFTRDSFAEDISWLNQKSFPDSNEEDIYEPKYIPEKKYSADTDDIPELELPEATPTNKWRPEKCRKFCPGPEPCNLISTLKT